MTARPQEVAQGPAVWGGGHRADSRTLFPILLASRLRRSCISFSLPGSLSLFPFSLGFIFLIQYVFCLRIAIFLSPSEYPPFQGFSVSVSLSIFVSGFLSVSILSSLSLLSLVSRVP